MNIKNLINEYLGDTELQFIRILENITKGSEFRVYLVGGLLRDIVIGLKPNELDIAVEGDIDVLIKLLSDNCSIIQETEFKTFKLKYKDIFVDIALARKESYIPKGSLPNITVASLREDLSRRDFTINALALEIYPTSSNYLIDPFNAIKDINEKKIKVIHADSFKDDPTRIFRAIRFSERLSFALDDETLKLLDQDKNRIGALTPARILNEMVKIIDEIYPLPILLKLQKYNIFSHFLPLEKEINVLFENNKSAINNWDYFILYLSKHINELTFKESMNRYPITKKTRTFIRNAYNLRRIIKEIKNSNVDRLNLEKFISLEGIIQPSFDAELSLSPSNEEEIIRDLILRLSHTKVLINAQDLINLGIQKGKNIGEAFKALRYKKFQLTLKTKEEEIKYIRDSCF